MIWLPFPPLRHSQIQTWLPFRSQAPPSRRHLRPRQLKAFAAILRRKLKVQQKAKAPTDLRLRRKRKRGF
jgi:hypothetical protein